MSDEAVVSLRDIAERMDTDKPAQRLYGNGPPFDPDRYRAYNTDDLSFPLVTVEVDDPWGPVESADPPNSRVVKGAIDAGHLHAKLTYNGVPYLDTVNPPSSFPEGDNGMIQYPGDSASSGKWMYFYNLFFADYNAYDLGMINRTPENESRPEGYTDKGIIENHRWVDPNERDTQTDEWRSIRNVVDRHRNGVRHRMLCQNMRLPSSSGILGVRRNRAEEFGERFGAAGFDIVGMCEVPSKTLLNHVKQGYDSDYPDNERKWAPKDLGVLVGQRRNGESTVQRKISWKEANRYEESGPAGAGLSKEGWLRTVIQVTTLPGDPKFEVFVTHLQGVFGGRKDRKQQVKISQMRELRDEIKERNEEKPHQPKIVMGDFNIHSRDGGYGDGVRNAQYFSNFMQQMHSVGMQDVWLTYGGPGPDNKKHKPQSDGYSLDPFQPVNSSYYRGNRLDYVFVEKPRSVHDIHIDISRAKNVTWPSPEYNVDYLSDHIGVVFDIITSPSS